MSDVQCDRCGEDAESRGTLPAGQGQSYRFCSSCWNKLHRWVEQGRKRNLIDE